MDMNIDELKKKIIYRAQYRGTKEMDRLMSSFVNMYIDKFDIKTEEKVEFVNKDIEELKIKIAKKLG